MRRSLLVALTLLAMHQHAEGQTGVLAGNQLFKLGSRGGDAVVEVRFGPPTNLRLYAFSNLTNRATDLRTGSPVFIPPLLGITSFQFVNLANLLGLSLTRVRFLQHLRGQQGIVGLDRPGSTADLARRGLSALATVRPGVLGSLLRPRTAVRIPGTAVSILAAAAVPPGLRNRLVELASKLPGRSIFVVLGSAGVTPFRVLVEGDRNVYVVASGRPRLGDIPVWAFPPLIRFRNRHFMRLGFRLAMPEVGAEGALRRFLRSGPAGTRVGPLLKEKRVSRRDGTLRVLGDALEREDHFDRIVKRREYAGADRRDVALNLEAVRELGTELDRARGRLAASWMIGDVYGATAIRRTIERLEALGRRLGVRLG